MASPLQFSVRQLLIAVAFVAVGIVALRNANSYWLSAIWGIMPLLLGIAILLVIFRRGSAQAFWIGFALFGVLYAGIVVIAYWPNIGPYPLASHQLWTTRLTDLAYAKTIPEAERQPQIANPDFKGDPSAASGFGGSSFGGGFPGSGFTNFGSGFGNGSANYVPPTIANPAYVDMLTFQQIGHALWLVILAALGGKLAQWIYAQGPGARNQEPGRS